jgi:hypothetical protein
MGIAVPAERQIYRNSSEGLWIFITITLKAFVIHMGLTINIATPGRVTATNGFVVPLQPHPSTR